MKKLADHTGLRWLYAKLFMRWIKSHVETLCGVEVQRFIDRFKVLPTGYTVLKTEGRQFNVTSYEKWFDKFDLTLQKTCVNLAYAKYKTSKGIQSAIEITPVLHLQFGNGKKALTEQQIRYLKQNVLKPLTQSLYEVIAVHFFPSVVQSTYKNMGLRLNIQYKVQGQYIHCS